MATPTIFTTSLSLVESRLDPKSMQPLVQALRQRLENSKYLASPLYKLVIFRKSIVSEIGVDDTYIGLVNIDGTRGSYVATSEKESISSAAIFRKKEILFPKLRPYLSKTYVAEFDGICSTEFHVLAAHGALPDYIAAVLRSDVAVALTSYLMTGNTLPRLQTADIQDFPIPVPPIGVQQEIIERLEASKAQMGALETEATQLLSKVRDVIYESLALPRISSDRLVVNERIFFVRAEQVSGNIFDPKTHAPRSVALLKSLAHTTFPTVPLRNVITHRMAGDWGEDEDFADDLDEYERRLVIRGTEFDNDLNLRIENGREKYRKVKVEKLIRMQVEVGDILIEKSGGSPDQPVGRVAILEDALLQSQSICYSNFVEKIKPDPAKVLPAYLFHYLRFVHAIGITDLLQSQTNGIRNLMIHRYLGLPVSLPPLPKQAEIVAEIDALQGEAIALRAKAKEVLDSAKRDVEKMILGD